MFEFRLKFHRCFFLKGPITNIPALIKIMAWRRPADKPLLSNPGLGWLYVFSSFPPRPPRPPRPQRPRPPPQNLFPLTSKPFQLNLWYLAQRIYGSGEMYWMTFPRLWPKVTAVALISKDLLVCAIKWEPLIGCFFFKVKHYFGHISEMVGPIDVKWRGSELIWCWADCMTLPFDHTHDLDLGVWRSESEIALSQEWGGRLIMNEKDVSHPFMTMILTCVTMVRWTNV